MKKTPKNRDDFSKPVIRELGRRVSHICSNPECHVQTLAASSKPSGTQTIGVAAHIHAAAPGGPRYLSSMTPEQRKSIENGIWLCSNCSTKIDRDEYSYPAEKLREWKSQAEAKGREYLGRKVPSEEDIVSTLASVLTGSTKTALANAIANTHKATTDALEQLDPRIMVKTGHQDGITEYLLTPKEPVSISINIKANNAQENAERYQRFIERGEPLRLSTGDFTIEGSKLLETLVEGAPGELVLGTQEKPATQKVRLTDPITGTTEYFDDIQGAATLGARYFTFRGRGYGGLLNIEISRSLNDENEPPLFKHEIDYGLWEGKDIRRLKYLNKISSFYEKLFSGWLLQTTIEIDGMEVLTIKGTANHGEFIENVATILSHISNAAVIAQHTNSEIEFSKDISFSGENYAEARKISRRMQRKESYVATDLAKDPTFTLVYVGEDEITENPLLSEAKTNINLMLNERETIEILGKSILLPRKVHRLHSVILIAPKPPRSIKNGEKILVECKRCEDFTYSIEYEDQAST